ncbi:aldehyde dehydrogenase family protein [Roseiconus nitratireducens]|uniref:L-glutamate gamma-semialdehyde dehydrogenase n=1 Tax=Roseiconus nitratireducens TaxID=2605748 RepID=A0A5M6D452_9BACT|nr:proline dehydrogenase family protein [Roseiconus nitratireducens]KAA5542297.1 aldehyde dehydrogenase family protein [Roseiconus nitratireducens]
MICSDGRLEETLADLQAGGPELDHAELAARLAERLLVRSHELLTPEEKRQQAELNRMISLPEDKSTLVQMTDQAFRTGRNVRVADQLTHILDLQGIPRFFSPLDRAMLRGFQSFGGYLPGVAVPLVKDKMRKETANVILPAETEMLRQHLSQRLDQGVRMNVNFLGEALLGEQEAQRRLQLYLHALQIPEVECLSVKISTIYSQISTLAWKQTLNVLADRLELLYRAAARERFQFPDGREVPKFVYLDMEEYRDLHLTADALMTTLDRDGLGDVRAGIALQAYVPDSYDVLRRLTEWAGSRVAAGGTPLTVRIVKGANMEMERVEASLMGWPQAPYKTKLQTDANYKRMVGWALDPRHRDVLRVGIASHNLFDVAWSLITAYRQDALQRVQFEMLEGMANHQRRALFELAGNMLLYAPACRREEFLHAIGYLIRRLDENTGEENFLRHTFEIEPGSEAWSKLRAAFEESVQNISTVSDQPRRQQDRNLAPCQPAAPESLDAFKNEPDTDFSLRQNVRWAQEQIYDAWKDRCGSDATELPLYDDGRQRSWYESTDPSRPGVVVCRYPMADDQDVEAAIARGRNAAEGWREMGPERRRELLRAAAQRIRERRADLMGAALADGGKTLHESDPEVSEAIDFVEFYALTATELYQRESIECAPRGLAVVVSPWNFPIAIPCGGVAASLAAGNTVILKPASDTVLPAWVICECFWQAGIPRDVLQLLPCRGGGPGQRLVSDDGVDVVILTGGTETAVAMLDDKPEMDLLAETGGKNATIVSGLSDRDLAIKHVLHSAFSHSGQKCSATSLLLLQEEVYEDPRFKELLCDAVRSLHVGSAWEADTKMGPLIRPPRGALERGLKELEHDEQWAVMPEHRGDNPQLWSPGVKWNVAAGSFTHCTELFGPVLAVMKYRHLEDAIATVNATGFGLTSGLESLDDREQSIWIDAVKAGNLYVNRSTTGAVVLRQPFGGMGKSAFGPGIKAGGPNYVIPLMDIRDAAEPATAGRDPSVQSPPLRGLLKRLTTMDVSEPPMNSTSTVNPTSTAKSTSTVETAGTPTRRWTAADRQRVVRAIDSIERWAEQEFTAENDPMRLIGQDNYRRYLPMTHVRIRLDPTVTLADLLIMVAAAVRVGARITISHGEGVAEAMLDDFAKLTDAWAGRVEVVQESEQALVEAIDEGQVDRLRMPGREPVAEPIRRAANQHQIYIARAEVVADGRIEPLWYLREQAVSVDYHRYGNLGARADEVRAEPA